MPPVMFSVVTKYHKGRHSLFLYNLEIFCAFTQDILRSPIKELASKIVTYLNENSIAKSNDSVSNQSNEQGTEFNQPQG